MSAYLATHGGKDLFQTGGSADHIITVPALNAIANSQDGLIIFNTVSAKLSETIQYFLTFDDVIKVIHFGKAVGALSVEGTAFCNKQGDIPGINRLVSAFYSLRGKVLPAALKGIGLQVIMTDAQINIVGHPDTLADFSFQFSVVDHTQAS